ncbi:hypothetical protein EI427_13845 [Flammeovirga pectinis]|uniref:Transporter n=1 Tax=Flammeovirga pectinis TaxID=2494373 RepID=A0A3Q9FS58_9BACT|nr:hypothetical protein [Flammeovirga pectinis]AZQ63285.1 hypothetical protein EI427_13845 [Flammeovirga pectinis]
MKILFICLLLLISSITFAQDEEIDASKPTNFYTQINNQLEYNSRKSGGNVMGYRAEIIYSPSEAHLILAEIPLMYNDQTEKFGLGDFRARYFYLPYKNYDKFFGAFGPSVDVFAPTGSFENGLGTSSWLVQPGVTAGLMIADWIQAFPILSYQYTSVPTADQIPTEFKEAQHGISFQVITPIIFSEKFFMQVTPIYTASNLTKTRQDRYIQEVFAQYAITPKLQTSVFYRGVFEDEDHTVRLGCVVFL